MNAVVRFLKRNLFNIICGVVVLASIGLGAVGMSKMSDVTDQMSAIKSLYGKFTASSRNPANDRTIAAERNRVETVQRYYDALLEVAYRFDDFEPLPPPAGEPGFPNPSLTARLRFRDDYSARFDLMLERLNAGTPPSAADIEEERVIMEEEKQAARRFGIDQDEEPQASPSSPKSTDIEETHPSGLITTAEARESPEARAAIRRARSIFCYADDDAFDRSAAMSDQGPFKAPDPKDMWKAQVSLWIQEDLVASLARINAAAAQALQDRNERAWVGVLPIKELISIRVSDYLPVDKLRPKRDLRGDEPADPPASSEAVFTQNTSTDLYDLVQFTVKMVVDPRDLPTLIDEICKDRFHTVLNVAYLYEPRALESLDMTGKIYGAEPAVKVMLDFETIFFGEVYRRLMPDAVLEELGKTRPVEDDQKD